MRIVFKWEGEEFDTGSLRVREVEALEAQLGVRYIELRPLASMTHKLAIMSTFLLRSKSEAEVAKIIEAIDVDAVEEMFTIGEDDLPSYYEDGMPDPKVPGLATVGSSGAPGPSDGLPAS